MNDTIAGASPVEQSVGRHVPGLISAEMSQYSDGAYADHGSARDQLERFAAEVQAPLLARIRELTLYAAGVEAERENAREEARQNFVRAREWADRCGAAESQRDEALADAVRVYTKLNGLHVSARAHRDRVRELEEELKAAKAETETAYDVTWRQPLSDEIEALRKDAKRYRWLRDAENGGELSVGQQCSVCDEYPKYEEVAWYFDIELDSLIDAAMMAEVNGISL